jgi:hypothetical protein
LRRTTGCLPPTWNNIERRIPAQCLSFCFVDPFGLDIHFETIRRLGASRPMDFLVPLALGMDATRNWELYKQPGNAKVERFIGDRTWRERWAAAERGGPSPIRFLARGPEILERATGAGFLSTDQVLRGIRPGRRKSPIL